MKFKGIKLSGRTLALLTAALVMLGSGGVLGTRAALSAETGDRLADFGTDAISVALYEGSKSKTIADGGAIYADLGDSVEPGMTYSDEVGVVNDGAAPEYVRVIVRKSWTAPNAETKDTKLDPSIIELTYDESKWNAVKGLSDEETIYYYKPGALAANDSAALFTSLRISGKVASKADGIDVVTEEQGDEKVTITTYSYKYNGYTFKIEAEAQSVQTHHYDDAIKSVWGVSAGETGISF